MLPGGGQSSSGFGSGFGSFYVVSKALSGAPFGRSDLRDVDRFPPGTSLRCVPGLNSGHPGFPGFIVFSERLGADD